MLILSGEIKSFYGEDPSQSPDYCRMINADKAGRMESFIEHGQLIQGGNTDAAGCYVASTIITGVSPDDPVMLEEIFGPVLPVI